MVNVNEVGGVMQAVVEKYGIDAWFGYADDLLEVAANLRKICSLGQVVNKASRDLNPPSWRKKEELHEIRYKEVLKEFGFHFADYNVFFLVSSRKQYLEEAITFLDSCDRDTLAQNDGLGEFFSGPLPEDERYKSFEMGHALGYPVCCIRHWFLSRQYWRDLSKRKVPTSEWSENAKVYEHALVPWGICSSNCKPSIEYTKKAIKLYSRWISLPEKFTNAKLSWNSEFIESLYRPSALVWRKNMNNIIRRHEKERKDGYAIVLEALAKLRSGQVNDVEK